MEQVFSFRAEAWVDLQNFFGLLGDKAFGIDVIERANAGEDHRCQFSSSHGLRAIQSAARMVEDGHVLLETLRPLPLAENSLEREEPATILHGSEARALKNALLATTRRGSISSRVATL
jgi:hypothetical protein